MRRVAHRAARILLTGIAALAPSVSAQEAQFTGEATQTLQGDDLARACIEAGTASERDLAPVVGGAMLNPLTPFLDAIAKGADSPLPLREALPAHRIVDAIYASADDGGAVVSTR